MARSCTILTLVVLLAGGLKTASAEYFDVVIEDNPVAYWRLNELSGTTFHDSAGSHTGQLSGAATLGRAGVLRGSDTAINFSGGLIRVPFSADLDGNAFSVEAWARADEFGDAWRSPLMFRWADTSAAPFYACYGYNFYIDRFNDNWEFWVGQRASANSWSMVNGPDAELDKWTHLVGTYDGATQRFHVDGDLVGSKATAHGVLAEGMPTSLYIAGSPRFMGDLDEIAVYDSALSPNRVLAHYETALGIPEPGTITLLCLGLTFVAIRSLQRRSRQFRSSSQATLPPR